MNNSQFPAVAPLLADVYTARLADVYTDADIEAVLQNTNLRILLTLTDEKSRDNFESRRPGTAQD